MRELLPTLAACALLAGPASGIPQNFGGAFFGINFTPNPVEDDFTEALVATAAWEDGELPGDWRALPSVDGDGVGQLTVNPYVFGHRPAAVFANRHGSELRSISVLYLDAGRFYNPRPGEEVPRDELRARQREFKNRYAELEKDLGKTLAKRSRNSPRHTNVGRTAFLRSSYRDFPLGDLLLRLSAIEGHSVSLTILRAADASTHYLDGDVASLGKRERRERLQANVERRDNGDTLIAGIPMFQQGQRPYCAVSTLGMATHYLGLRMGTDALAAGARFRSTGSAKGAKLLDLYRAAAEESDAVVQRGGKFDLRRAKTYLEKGFPIVVWRRYSEERDRLHRAAARGEPLPTIGDDDRSTWPTSKEAPGHASVVTGFNADTGEVIFSESWGEHARDKRMRAEELEATSYAVFYFKI